MIIISSLALGYTTTLFFLLYYFIGRVNFNKVNNKTSFVREKKKSDIRVGTCRNYVRYGRNHLFNQNDRA